MLQQYLPFTVLKQLINTKRHTADQVATVLTVYGIETATTITLSLTLTLLQQYLPFTVLKLEK